jgi:outer membrane protein assembly factor BamD (BamD/ComL family)
VVTPSSLDAEIALVRDARAALRGGDAARSLALLDEHDRRFPGGALAEDCAAERVYALCALGDSAGARSAAARFLSDHPYSPHAASVRASCVSSGGMN